MTRLERYIREADECGAIIVIREIAAQIKKFESELKCTKNGFKRTCISQEIERYNKYRKTLEEMYID